MGSGQGVARQRQAIVEGLKNSVLEFNDGVAGTTPADVMQLMMVTQYLTCSRTLGIRGAPFSFRTDQGRSEMCSPRCARGSWRRILLARRPWHIQQALT